MASGGFDFGPFHLRPDDRRLTRQGEPIELNARYLDALILLVRNGGKLVSKSRFLDEVWRGVPVTDEALTQCVKTLRRRLGDDVASPRFIETVPKHGYRFIAAVVWKDDISRPADPVSTQVKTRSAARGIWVLGASGTAGGALAGLLGGVIYGVLSASQPLENGLGATSVLAVMVSLTVIVGVLAGAGIGFGIALANRGFDRIGPWSIFGGAAGGVLIGAVTKLLGVDAIDLLFGQAPRDITGAPEGLVLGGAAGLAVWLASRAPFSRSLRLSVAVAGVIGGLAGIGITLAGGRLMAGSLDLLSRQFPDSSLRMDFLGRLFGERGLGPVSEVVLGGLEGFLLTSCVALMMTLALRRFAPGQAPV